MARRKGGGATAKGPTKKVPGNISYSQAAKLRVETDEGQFRFFSEEQFADVYGIPWDPRYASARHRHQAIAQMRKGDGTKAAVVQGAMGKPGAVPSPAVTAGLRSTALRPTAAKTGKQQKAAPKKKAPVKPARKPKADGQGQEVDTKTGAQAARPHGIVAQDEPVESDGVTGVPMKAWPPEWNMAATPKVDPWGRPDRNDAALVLRSALKTGRPSLVMGRLVLSVDPAEMAKDLGWGSAARVQDSLSVLSSDGAVELCCDGGRTLVTVWPGVALSSTSVGNLSCACRGADPGFKGKPLAKRRDPVPSNMAAPVGSDESLGVPEPLRPGSWSDIMDRAARTGNRVASAVMRHALNDAPFRLLGGAPCVSLPPGSGDGSVAMAVSSTSEAVSAAVSCLQSAGLLGERIDGGKDGDGSSLYPLVPGEEVSTSERGSLVQWATRQVVREPRGPRSVPSAKAASVERLSDLPEWAPESWRQAVPRIASRSSKQAEFLNAAMAVLEPVAWQGSPVLRIDLDALSHELGCDRKKAQSKVDWAVREGHASRVGLDVGRCLVMLPGEPVTDGDRERFLAAAGIQDGASQEAPKPEPSHGVPRRAWPRGWKDAVDGVRRGSKLRRGIEAVLKGADIAIDDDGRVLASITHKELGRRMGGGNKEGANTSIALRSKGMLGRVPGTGSVCSDGRAAANSPVTYVLFPGVELGDRDLRLIAKAIGADAPVGVGAASEAVDPAATDAREATAVPQDATGVEAASDVEAVPDGHGATTVHEVGKASQTATPAPRAVAVPDDGGFDGSELVRAAKAAADAVLATAKDTDGRSRAEAVYDAAVRLGSLPELRAVRDEMRSNPVAYRANPAYAEALACGLSSGQLRSRAWFEPGYAAMVASAALNVVGA